MIVVDPAIPNFEAGSPRHSRNPIKLLWCLIRPEKLDVVTNYLNKLNLVGGMTVTEIRGSGSGDTEPERWRPRYTAAWVPRVKIELAIEADDVNEVEELVKELGKTGEVGDGKIFIFSVVDMMRIRTGERGASAL